ncbi:teichoic acid biosynthesis protein C [Streptomyces europaeiscabiei]|uniref:phage baseplate protein n=1 Tax=Streptomyces europaeiscabiei TaxID=146819 RepID=UPI0029B3074A|nr:teichoic acid biosynthesis protein C [Streptomyces europaeiscabiei]MDX3691521.1 teichoic acid biosynthesis protein C [Streptomyces europaeiscabiei]
MEFNSRMSPTRRGLLRTGAGVGLAALGLGYGARSASASVTATKRFDLSQPSYDLFRDNVLHSKRVQQSFAFDSVNKRLFVAAKRADSPESAGDLCISQLDLHGNYVSYMHLNGFGHGVAFGVRPSGTSSHLWIESNANGNGYGTKLAFIKYSAGTTLDSSSTSFGRFQPISGASEYTCSIDPVYNRMIVRYHKDGAKHIAVYELSDTDKGDFSNPLVKFTPPPISGTPQGYALYGSYMYFQTGDHYSDTNQAPGNTYLTSINVNTGKIAQGPVLTKAGSTLKWREPEGLAVYRTDAGESRLFLGFATGDEGDRRSSIFYKNVLV